MRCTLLATPCKSFSALSTLASNSSSKLVTQDAVKAYVDGGGGGSSVLAITSVDNPHNRLCTGHDYAEPHDVYRKRKFQNGTDVGAFF